MPDITVQIRYLTALPQTISETFTSVPVMSGLCCIWGGL